MPRRPKLRGLKDAGGTVAVEQYLDKWRGLSNNDAFRNDAFGKDTYLCETGEQRESEGGACKEERLTGTAGLSSFLRVFFGFGMSFWSSSS